MIFVKLIYVAYWIVLGAMIYKFEKRIAWLEEENEHLRALLDICGLKQNKKGSKLR